MAENSPKAIEVQPSPGVSPEPRGASQFAVIVNGIEIALVMGRGRPILADNQLKLAIEWTSTYTLSPVAVKQLIKALTGAVAEYEKQTNSKIPDVKSDAEREAAAAATRS